MTESQRPWMDDNLSDRERAEKLVENMTLEQKIAQLHGGMETINIYAASNEIDPEDEDAMEQLAMQIQIERHVPEIPELGIPRFRITNGPVGVGMGDGTPSPPATALPMTIGVAASFDPELAFKYGDIIGRETDDLGQHVLEGPGVCLHRTVTAGRNFEYFSEDPYLSGVMGIEVTKAIQAHDIIAMAKHYAVNDQEFERFRTNVEVDEQTLREMYLLPFEMVVKDGQVAAIMSAYNRVRGDYATENRYLLNDVLRGDWGFEGYVQSDFWSTRSAAASLNAGLDHEMPDAKWLNEDNVKAALEDTSLEIELVDRALVRRYTQMFRFNQFDREYAPREIDAAGNGAISREIGADMAVLLKNDKNILPLDPNSAGKILIVGQEKFAKYACQGGGGSSKVDPLYTVDPEPGLRDVIADLGGSATVESFIVERDLSNLEGAVEAAKGADTVLIMAGLIATEGADMPTMLMPQKQSDMIAELLKANDNSVVVLKSSAPLVMPWIDDAATVLEVWNQGAEDGHVVGDLVFGSVNPSGKVPTTYPKTEADWIGHDHPERYPGVNLGEGYNTITYSEGLEMGYRWFQANDVTPAFPFGYGLSYTSFELSDVSVAGSAAGVKVSATVKNTGDVAGAEVVQVYLGIPSEGQPPKRLVGFAKVQVEPGSSAAVEINIDADATHHPLSVWDVAARDFVVPSGEFTVYVGTSSDDDSHVEKFTV
ncbi:glycoside hydrolase family 3 C-terminal domain-containing protein [Corynebacterium breve]|uniref:Glycoside hydrolase family 3 C-terminal domain-containing protein n=1 Tax=Corynebacterium breve TaxID=3049799 RepID=A0ABY8VEN2_9CORY|nr:glycoside hydrolase family 3 C-terminal domain-containing protein [Corynebacterium breve]WIM67797.1 glycoside hydrolase family 3 C-terminal domain-containing protein [Corynebacterium breve]